MQFRFWQVAFIIAVGLAAMLLPVEAVFAVGDGRAGNDAYVKVRTIRVVERGTLAKFVDTAPKGPSHGDLAIFASDIYDHAEKKRLGTGEGFCVTVAPNRLAACQFTMHLAGGTLTHVGSGPLAPGSRATVALVGGTGVYKGVRGTQLHDERPTGPNELPVTDVTIELIQ